MSYKYFLFYIMTKYFILFLSFNLLVIFSTSSWAQGSAGNAATYESRSIIDMPTAGVLHKGNYAIGLQFFSGGGLAVNADFALLKNFNAGIALSGMNIIGTGDVKFQSIPGINLKYRFLDETLSMPAFAVGINTQGKGYYNSSSNRFEFFSPGAFIAVSKNFSWDLGDLALHGGINYSFENPANNFFMNYYFGLEQSLLNRMSITLEYNASAFEQESKRIASPGLVNFAWRYSLTDGFTLELQLRDLLEKVRAANSITRYVGIEYISRF